MPARKTSLSVVTDGSPRRSVKPKSVTQAASGGSRHELLVAMRDRVAKAVEDADTPPRDLAALSRRLLEIAKEIEALNAETEVDDIGEAAATPDEEWAAT